MASMTLTPEMKQSAPLFDQAAWDKMFPRGWGKSARETKSNWLMNQSNKTVAAGEAEAKRIGAQEDANKAEGTKIVRDSLTEANQPTMTEDMVRKALTLDTDRIARQTNESMRMLRSQLGAAGEIGGGRGAGIAANIALNKSGQITDARGGLFLATAKQAALDRARNFQNNLTLAQQVQSPVSTINLDWIQNALGLTLAQQGNEAQRSAVKDAAKASENAGWMGLAGSLGGALIGAL